MFLRRNRGEVSDKYDTVMHLLRATKKAEEAANCDAARRDKWLYHVMNHDWRASRIALLPAIRGEIGRIVSSEGSDNVAISARHCHKRHRAAHAISVAPIISLRGEAGMIAIKHAAGFWRGPPWDRVNEIASYRRTLRFESSMAGTPYRQIEGIASTAIHGIRRCQLRKQAPKPHQADAAIYQLADGVGIVMMPTIRHDSLLDAADYRALAISHFGGILGRHRAVGSARMMKLLDDAGAGDDI